MITILQRLGLTPTNDAHLWKQKWSTKISRLQFSFGGTLIAWALLDADIRAALPSWIPAAIGFGVLITAFILPAAVNTVQRKLTGQ
jgi:hypothetical protein